MSAVPTNDRVVNARVPGAAFELASEVLDRNRLSMSEAIRNTIRYIAETGSIPQCARSEQRSRLQVSDLRNFCAKISRTPMPGKDDYPGLTSEEMAERIRMERYGY